MIVGKVIEFASLPEQSGLSRSICLEDMMVRTCYVQQIRPTQLAFPRPCIPPQPLLLYAKENGCDDRFQGWGHQMLMYNNDFVKKIVVNNTFQ